MILHFRRMRFDLAAERNPVKKHAPQARGRCMRFCSPAACIFADDRHAFSADARHAFSQDPALAVLRIAVMRFVDSVRM